MQILRRDGTFLDDLSPHVIADDFPYLGERFDAIREIKQREYDMARMSNFGRLLLNKAGSKMRRIASVPQHLFDHARTVHGYDWFLDRKNLYRFTKMYPQYSFINGR